MKFKYLLLTGLFAISLTSCKTPSSSSSITSNNSSFQDNRTPKEKVLEVCDKIIEEFDNQSIFSSTQKINGNVILSSLDSNTSIYKQNKITVTDLIYDSVSEIVKEDDSKNKSLTSIKGNYKIQHTEEYTLEVENPEELNNFISEEAIDEKFMTIGDSMYCDLSSLFNDFFSEEEKLLSPDLKFVQNDISVMIDELVDEFMTNDSQLDVEIPSITPQDLLNEFVGDDSLFKDYLKYSDKDGLKLTLELKPADFNDLINDLMLEYYPESTIPISTIISMKTGKIIVDFNFSEDSIESMNYSLTGQFELLTGTYLLNSSLRGEAIVNDVTSFTYLEGYQSFTKFEDAGINFKDMLKDILGNINFEEQSKI